LGLVDSGSGTEVSATVSITGNYQNTDVLGFTSNASFGNIVGSYNAGVLTLTSAGNSATLAQWKAALDSVTFSSTAAVPSNATRTISFSITDLNNNASNTATRLVTVTDVDQVPVVTIGNGTTNYVGGTAAVAIDTNIGVSDTDSTNQASGTVTISNGFSSGDTLLFTSNNTLYGNLTASYNGNGTLTLTGSATDQQWANAFNSVAFSSTSTTYGNRTISFVVNDGTFNSTAVTKTVNVTNPAPVITTDSGSAAFTAGNNVTSTPVVIDAGLTFTDPATSTVQSATVAITGNYQSGKDVLNFTSNANFGNIVGSYNAGVLTLTSQGNSATLAQWQAALDSVTYTSTAVTPNNATRTIGFSITDGNSNVSNTATRQVTVTDVDQTPVVTVSGTAAVFVGADGTASTPIVIDPGISVSDLDNTTLASATVSITGNFASGEDVLAFTNNNATMGNITATYNALNGVLTLTSNNATATTAQWSAALKAVTYVDTAAVPNAATRTISFVANDGTLSGATATKAITVQSTDQTPVLTGSGSSATLGSNGTASVALNPGITLSDRGNTPLTTATIAITSGFQSGVDTLSFTNTGNIVGSYNATTGVLTLTSSDPKVTLAQWQAALNSVTYGESSTTVTGGTRTLSFTISDGLKTSAAVSSSVAVSARTPFVANVMPTPQTNSPNTNTTTSTSATVSNPLIVLTAIAPVTAPSPFPTIDTFTFGAGNGGGLVTTPRATNPNALAAPLQQIQVAYAPFSSLGANGPVRALPTQQMDIPVNQPFSLTLPNAAVNASTRDSGNSSSTVAVQVRQANGTALPSWVRFDAATGTLKGIAPSDGPRVLRLFVTERDRAGHVTRREVVIDLGAAQTVPVTPARGGPAHGPAANPQPHAALPVAKPSLSAQFARLRRELHIG
jgi:hypothetical protein